MVRTTVPDDEVPARPRANAAVTLATIALIIAVIGLIIAIGARNRADSAFDSSAKTENYTRETVEKALNEATKATPGGGVGADSVQPVNPHPTANGQ